MNSWYAARLIALRQQYGLTVDRREADALARVLSGCASTEIIVVRPSCGVEACSSRSRRCGDHCGMGRQRQRTHQLRRGASARRRPRHSGSPRVFRACGTVMETASSSSPAVPVRRRESPRPGQRPRRPRLDRTVTGPRSRAIIPKTSVVATVRINAAWTGTTTVGLANAETLTRLFECLASRQPYLCVVAGRSRSAGKCRAADIRPDTPNGHTPGTSR